MSKIWIVLYNKETKRYFTRYFDTLNEKEKYLRKMKYFLSRNLILIEDSTDIIYDRKENIK
ncbi:MAG: hypothetical protein IKL65_05600 [Bacilli bacterium]|nr:hypothetical protein [Bacilli bacterium]MBR6690788.1 hypothetical protein [Bacilli bacterium]